MFAGAWVHELDTFYKRHFSLQLLLLQELESQVVRSTGKARNSTSPDHARSFGHDLALSDNESVDSFSGKHRKMVRIGGSVDLEPSIDSEDFAPKNGSEIGVTCDL